MQNALGNDLDSYFEMFRDNLRHETEESGGRLRNYVDYEGGYRGEGARPITFLEVGEARPNTDPAGETPIMGHAQTDRWIYPEEWEWGDLITKREIIEQMSDPTSKIYQAAMKKMAIYEDREIVLPAFFGDAKYGKKGEKTATFNTTNYAPGGDGRRINIQLGSTNDSSDIGMTMKKLHQITETFYNLDVLLDDNETDSQIFCGCAARQNAELLELAKVNKDDYIEKPLIERGLVTSWMGINFVHSNRWEKSGNNRLLPVWLRSGIHMGSWVEMDGFLKENVNRKGNPHLYIQQRKGAVRVDENKVLQLPCLES